MTGTGYGWNKKWMDMYGTGNIWNRKWHDPEIMPFMKTKK
jgi:hypothetical protein